MRDDFSESLIIDKLNYKEFESKNIDSITKIIDLENSVMVELKSPKNLNSLMLADRAENQTNIAVASAITAYARIEMANLFKFLIDNGYTIFYCDTDCVVVNKPLPDDMVSSTELGKLKLEHTIKKGIFLAPKVYCLKTEEDKFISKVKGLNHDVEVSYLDFISLLSQGMSLEKEQTKWFKNFSEDTIKIKDQLYTLKATTNKRQLIYENNILVRTKPYIIKENNEGIVEIADEKD